VNTGIVLDVDDTSQSLRLKIKVQHAKLDEEKHPLGFLMQDGSAPPAADPPSTPQRASAAAEGSIEVDDDADGSRRVRPRRFEAADVEEEDDDCVMLD